MLDASNMTLFHSALEMLRVLIHNSTSSMTCGPAAPGGTKIISENCGIKGSFFYTFINVKMSVIGAVELEI
jgi:hypothetical protein